MYQPSLQDCSWFLIAKLTAYISSKVATVTSCQHLHSLTLAMSVHTRRKGGILETAKHEPAFRDLKIVRISSDRKNV